jgi:hypothetical protein
MTHEGSDSVCWATVCSAVADSLQVAWLLIYISVRPSSTVTLNWQQPAMPSFLQLVEQ